VRGNPLFSDDSISGKTREFDGVIQQRKKRDCVQTKGGRASDPDVSKHRSIRTLRCGKARGKNHPDCQIGRKTLGILFAETPTRCGSSLAITSPRPLID